MHLDYAKEHISKRLHMSFDISSFGCFTKRSFPTRWHLSLPWPCCATIETGEWACNRMPHLTQCGRVLSFSSCASSLLAVACDNFSVLVVDTDTRRVVRRFAGHRGRITDMVCLDGRQQVKQCMPRPQTRSLPRRVYFTMLGSHGQLNVQKFFGRKAVSSKPCQILLKDGKLCTYLQARMCSAYCRKCFLFNLCAQFHKLTKMFSKENFLNCVSPVPLINST